MKNLIIAVLVVLGLVIALAISIAPSFAAPVEVVHAVPTSAPEEAVKGLESTLGENYNHSTELADLDPSFVRVQLIWRGIETSSGTYDWTTDIAHDFLMDLAYASAVGEPILVLNSPPTFAVRSGSNCQVVKDNYVDDAADFIEEVLDKVDSMYIDVDYWEIGQNIDLDPGEGFYYDYDGRGCWDQNRQRYADMFNGIADVIHNDDANDVVIIGSVWFDDCDVNDDPFDPDDPDCDGHKFLDAILDKTDGYADAFAFSWVVGNHYGTWTSHDMSDIFTFVEGLADTWEIPYFYNRVAMTCTSYDGWCEGDDFEEDQAEWVYTSHNYCGTNSECLAWLWFSLDHQWQYYESGLLEYQTGNPQPAYDMFDAMPEP